eukprot:CAMPEP_0114671736 /NCGR_PEP_ID=MMETSP0191-20121206/41640_1 /TAXON_ID=126664 /ORGANISM="Sorites sp." /LENGTH=304 /DNA_ID=CAMNT_0001932245 /DNA_START=415 /DNA_END=1329 /DNA_ORIENTATION=+
MPPTRAEQAATAKKLKQSQIVVIIVSVISIFLCIGVIYLYLRVRCAENEADGKEFKHDVEKKNLVKELQSLKEKQKHQINPSNSPSSYNHNNNNNNNNNNGNSGEMMNHIDDNHNGNTGGNDGELGDGIPTNTGGFAMTDEENSDNDVAVPASNYNNNDIDAVLAEGKPDGGANIVVDEESLKTDDDFDNGNDIDVDEISENAPNNENGVYKPQLQDMVNQNIKKKQDKKNSGLKRNDSVNDHIYLVEQIERQQAKENENKNNNNVDNIELFGNALKQGINDENLDFNDIVEEMEMDRRKSNAQ